MGASLLRTAGAVLFLGLATLGANGCDSSSDGTPAPGATGGFKHQAFYEQLQAEAEHFTERNGEWVEDYGDAPFYGLAFYSWEGTARQDAAWLSRSARARDYALTVVDKPSLLTDDVNEIAMSALGLTDYIAATGDGTPLPALDAVIDQIDGTVKSFGYYIELDLGWAFTTYGATSISGLVGLMNLQYAAVLDNERAAERVAFAQLQLAEIEKKAFNGSFYRFDSSQEKLYLYPNVTMILYHARLFQLTGEERHRERAVALYQAVQPLRVDMGQGRVRYRSPYSAEYMHAQTEDYATLSSQNYLLFSLMLLHQITGEQAYLTEADAELEALSQELFKPWCLGDLKQRVDACQAPCDSTETCVVDSCQPNSCARGVLHHWMDGRLAEPQDEEFFCTGCNLQLLYLMWYRQNRILQ